MSLYNYKGKPKSFIAKKILFEKEIQERLGCQIFHLKKDKKLSNLNLISYFKPNFSSSNTSDIQKQPPEGPGRFPGIGGNAGNHGNNRKFHKSDQTLYQTKRYINILCLGKISLQKAVRMKLSVVSGFSNMLYGKKRKPGNAGN